MTPPCHDHTTHRISMRQHRHRLRRHPRHSHHHHPRHLPLLIGTLLLLAVSNVNVNVNHRRHLHVESFTFTHSHYSHCHSNSSSSSSGRLSNHLSSSKQRRRRQRRASPRLNLKSEHNLEELQRAARDPKAFEAYVLRKKQESEPGSSENTSHNDHSDVTTPVNEQKKSGGYVPIEQWDEERGKNKDSLTWEERVQFDGLRNGNRYRQNEILRHHLR